MTNFFDGIEDMEQQAAAIQPLPRPERKSEEQLKTEARLKTINELRNRYPKVIAKSFFVQLKGTLDTRDAGLSAVVFGEIPTINFVEIKELTVGKKADLNRKIVTGGGKMSNTDVGIEKMRVQISKIGHAVFIEDDEGTVESYTIDEQVDWSTLPPDQQNKFLRGLGSIDEREILEAMVALESGYGTFLDFYGSTIYAEMKLQQEELLQGDQE